MIHFVVKSKLMFFMDPFVNYDKPRRIKLHDIELMCFSCLEQNTIDRECHNQRPQSFSGTRRLSRNMWDHIIILIISLFQEDDIFDMHASLTYGPQLQR